MKSIQNGLRTSLPPMRWPWYITLPVAFLIFHLGTRASIYFTVAPGTSLWYWPIPLGLILIQWWGPKVLLPLYLNAVVSAGLWGLPQQQFWPIYALPETGQVFLSWLLFTRLNRGLPWLPDFKNQQRFLIWGIFVPSLIGNLWLQAQFLWLGDIRLADIGPTFLTNWVADLLGNLVVALSALYFLTPVMEKAGLSLTNSGQRASVGARLDLLAWLKIALLFGLIWIDSFWLSPQDYWFIYGIIILGVAFEAGLTLVFAVNAWTICCVLFLPAFLPGLYHWHWLAKENWSVVYLSLICLFVAGISVARALGELRANMETLAESESRFRLLAENSTDMISRHDPLGNYLYASPACRTLLGYDPEELVGHSAFEFIHPDDIPFTDQVRSNIIEQPIDSTTVFRIRRKNGDYIWLETTSHTIFDKESGDALEIHAATRNVSERKQAEDALRQSEGRFRALVENAPEAIVVFDPEKGVFTDCNNNACRLYQFSRDEMLAKNPIDLSPPFQPDGRPSAESALEKLQQAIAGESPRFEWTHRNAQGEDIPCEINLTRLPSSEGVFIRGSVVNIAERKQAEEQVRLLQSILIGVSTVDDLASMLEVVLRRVCERTGWVFGQAWLPRRDRSVLDHSVSWFSDTGLEKFKAVSVRTAFSPGQGLPGRVWLSKQPVWLENAALDPNFPRAEVAAQLGLKAALGLPILAHGEVVGVIEFFLREQRTEDEWLVNIIAAVAAQLGLVMERKRAEEALRVSETRFRALIEKSSDAILMVDSAWVIFFLSPSHERITGYRPEQRMGHSLFDTVHPDDREIALQRLTNILEAPNQVYLPPIRARHADGSWRWVEAVVRNLLGEPSVEAVVINFRDITERKQAENAILQIEDITLSLRAAENSAQLQSLLLNKLVTMYRIEYAAAFLLKDQKIVLVSSVGDQVHGEFKLNFQKLSELLYTKKPQLVEGQLVNLRSKVLIVPFFAQDNLLGGVLLDWSQQQKLDANDLHVFNTLTDVMGTALQRIGLVETLEQKVRERTRELSILYSLSTAASSSLELEIVLERSMEHILTIMEIKKGIIYLPEHDQTLRVAASRGFADTRIKELNKKGGDILAQEVARKKIPIIVNDLAADHRLGRSGTKEAGSYASFPMVSNGQLMGILAIWGNPDFDDSTSSLFSAVSDRVGMAIENALLYSRLREIAAVETRQELARDLHDSVTQSLYSLMLMAGSTKRLLESGSSIEAVKQSSERVEEIAHQALKEMRLLLYELHPPQLVQDGLSIALRQRVEAVESRSGINVQTKIADLPKLPRLMEENLYYIVQEAMNNILKHSASSRATLELYVAGKKIILQVSDFGKGFEMEKINMGMGLEDIRERVGILGGSLSIDSKPGSGTRLRVEIKNPNIHEDV